MVRESANDGLFRVCLTCDNELLQGQAGEDSTDGRKTVDGVGEEKMSVKFGMVWDQSSDKNFGVLESFLFIMMFSS